MGHIFTNHEEDLQFGNIEMRYHVYSISNIRDHPSICEIYFTVHSKVMQKLSEPNAVRCDGFYLKFSAVGAGDAGDAAASHSKILWVKLIRFE